MNNDYYGLLEKYLDPNFKDLNQKLAIERELRLFTLNWVIIVPIMNMRLSDKEIVHDFVDEWSISNDKRAKEFLLKNKDVFTKSIGTVCYNNAILSDVPCFYFQKKFTGLEVLTIDFTKELNYYHKLLNGYLNNIWLFKDHGCHSPIAFSQLDDNPDFSSQVNFLQAFNKNCEGKHPVLNVDYAFIQEWKKVVTDDYMRLLNTNETQVNNYNSDSDTRVTQVKYKELTRIQRAYLFLLNARQHENVLQRIASIMSVLECFFTFEDKFARRNTCERTTFYLDNNLDIIKKNMIVIKKAYSLRSDYLHGEAGSKYYDDIQNLSKDLDSILRKVFKKIITQDLGIFQMDLTDGFKDFLLSITPENHDIYCKCLE